MKRVLPVLLLLAAPARAEVEGAHQIFAAHDESGFDDTTTLDETGGKLILVLAGGGGARVVDLDQPAANGPRFDLAKLPAPPTEVHLLETGDLLAIAGEPGSVSATVLTSDGRIAVSYPPVTALAFNRIGGYDMLALLSVKGDAYDLRWIKRTGGAIVAKRHLTITGPERRVTGLSPPILFYMWRAGYTQLVGKKEGGYDKKADRRLPDSEVTVNLIAGQIVHDEVPADVMAHAQVLAARRDHLNHDAFVLLTADGKGLEMITRDDHRVPVKLRDGADYDMNSLQQAETPDGRLAFSLVAGGIMDLYVLDAVGAPAGLARIPTDGHPLGWHLRGTTLEVLSKHKHYGRGGADVTVYDMKG